MDSQRTGLLDHADMRQVMQLAPAERQALRRAIHQGLRHKSAQQKNFAAALVTQSTVEMELPCDIGDYTDFYVGIHHATAVGRQFRPDQPLMPNYQWVPIGYHGKASTAQASGTPFHRPRGQVLTADGATPVLAPSARLKSLSRKPPPL